MLKLNKKFILLMIFFILIIFSISAVSASDDIVNGTDVDNVDDDNGLVSIITIPDDNLSYSGGVGSVNASDSNPIFGEVNITTPSLELSMKSEDNNPANSYVDLLIEYGDYYLNVNTKNHLFSLNNGWKYDYSNDFSKYVDIIAFSDNNRLLLNINLLNISSYQPIKLNMFDYLIQSLLKAFNSFFNMLF